MGTSKEREGRMGMKSRQKKSNSGPGPRARSGAEAVAFNPQDSAGSPLGVDTGRSAGPREGAGDFHPGSLHRTDRDGRRARLAAGPELAAVLTPLAPEEQAGSGPWTNSARLARSPSHPGAGERSRACRGLPVA